MTTESEIAWLAGLLEGEGCFYFRQASTGSSLVIQIYMNDLDVIERTAAAMPDHTPIKTKTHKNPKHNTSYGFTWTGRAAADVMWAVLPHMGKRRTEKILDSLADWYDSRMATCAHCGVGFVQPAGRAGNRVTCTTECAKARNGEKMLANYHARKGTKMTDPDEFDENVEPQPFEENDDFPGDDGE